MYGTFWALLLSVPLSECKVPAAVTEDPENLPYLSLNHGIISQNAMKKSLLHIKSDGYHPSQMGGMTN